ncbi:MAG: hypothetical protein WC942_08805 [Clostridia bacterium]|jgi:hypothetical protein
MTNKLGQTNRDSQMEKQVPGEITPVEDPNEIVAPEGATAEPVPVEEMQEEAGPVDRITKLQEDVKNLEREISEYLKSSFDIELSSSEMNDLMRKTLSSIASFISDVTTDRIEEITDLKED